MKKRKKIVIVSGVISIILVVLNYIGTFRLCGGYYYGECMDIAYNIIINFFPVIPLFIFSLIIYKMREEIFESWWKFAKIWIPLSMLAILVAPSYSHNWIFPIVKGSVALFSSSIFVIISLVLIIRQSIKEKKVRS